MSKIRVLQFSPHDENCGVGKYQENFMSEYAKMPQEIETDFFDSSPYKTRVMDQTALNETLDRLKEKLSRYDILHIQHEFGLFSGSEFSQIVDVAKSINKKVIVTIHLSPALAFKFQRRGGIGPRSIIHYLRQKRLHHIFVGRHIVPFRKADLLIVHNNGALNSLISYGIDENKIIKYNHPVLDISETDDSCVEIAQALNKQRDDVIFSVIGFMHKYKGVEDAVRALKYLPTNYKLAIIGGMQPFSDETNIYNNIATLIDTLNLKDRVYITGYVEDDNRLNSLIRETNICVYPYNNKYYGQVSSGALNLAFANERSVIAYPVDSFKEINDFGQIIFCGAQSYYELAREIQRLDIDKQVVLGRKYAKKYSWPVTAKITLEAYKSI